MMGPSNRMKMRKVLGCDKHEICLYMAVFLPFAESVSRWIAKLLCRIFGHTMDRVCRRSKYMHSVDVNGSTLVVRDKIAIFSEFSWECLKSVIFVYFSNNCKTFLVC